MEEETIESGAASLLYQIEVIIVNSHRIFFDLFLGCPEGENYPEVEATRLFKELLGYGCFVSLALSSYNFGPEVGKTIADDMITSLTSSSYYASIEKIYEQYVTRFGDVIDLRSIAPTADVASVRIMKIHHAYRSQRKRIYSFLLAFVGKINDLINEFFVGAAQKD